MRNHDILQCQIAIIGDHHLETCLRADGTTGRSAHIKCNPWGSPGHRCRPTSYFQATICGIGPSGGSDDFHLDLCVSAARIGLIYFGCRTSLGVGQNFNHWISTGRKNRVGIHRAVADQKSFEWRSITQSGDDCSKCLPLSNGGDCGCGKTELCINPINNRVLLPQIPRGHVRSECGYVTGTIGWGTYRNPGLSPLDHHVVLFGGRTAPNRLACGCRAANGITIGYFAGTVGGESQEKATRTLIHCNKLTDAFR